MWAVETPNQSHDKTLKTVSLKYSKYLLILGLGYNTHMSVNNHTISRPREKLNILDKSKWLTHPSVKQGLECLADQ
jgi:hypothetical protein